MSLSPPLLYLNLLKRMGQSSSSLHSKTDAFLPKAHAWTLLCKPIYLPNTGSLSSIFVSFVFKYWRTIVKLPSYFHRCAVLRIVAFYDCAASLRFSQLYLRAMWMLQSLPMSKIKTIYILKNVGVPLACSMIYVPWTLELWNYVSIMFHCRASTILNLWHESPLFDWATHLVQR